MTIYTVEIDGALEQKRVFPKLSDAIRYWDREAYGATGGIAVMVTDKEGIVTRDGYILKVTHDQVYLNPNLVDA